MFSVWCSVFCLFDVCGSLFLVRCLWFVVRFAPCTKQKIPDLFQDPGFTRCSVFPSTKCSGQALFVVRCSRLQFRKAALQMPLNRICNSRMSGICNSALFFLPIRLIHFPAAPGSAQTKHYGDAAANGRATARGLPVDWKSYRDRPEEVVVPVPWRPDPSPKTVRVLVLLWSILRYFSFLLYFSLIDGYLFACAYFRMTTLRLTTPLLSTTFTT